MTGIALERIDAARLVRIEQLAASDTERQFRALVDHSPVGMCVHVDGRFAYVNQALVSTLGAQSADQVIGRRITDFIHPDSLAGVLEQISSRRSDGDGTAPMEITAVTLDGATRDLEALATRTHWEGRPAHKVVLRDVTVQKAAEANLRFQAALVAHVSDAIISTTASGYVTSWNPAAETLYQRPAVDALGLPIGEVVGDDLDLAATVARGGVVHTVHRTGETALAVRVSVSRMDDGYVVLCTNQTALRRVEQRCQAVVASLHEGVIVIAADGTVESVNPAALRIFGAPRTGLGIVEIAKVADVPVYDGDGRPLTRQQGPLMETFKLSPRRGCVYGMDRFSDGERVWVSVNWSLLDPADPDGSSLLVSIVDVTDQHNAHRRLAHQATHDVLTGIPNRAHMVTLLNDSIGSDEYCWGAVLFIDLNKFKAINDELGHHAGDVVLAITSQRLRQILGPDHVVGRVGGDEFVALLAGPMRRAKVDAVVGRLHLALRKPIRIPGDGTAAPSTRVHVSASIGVVHVRPDERRGAAELLRAADAAMYRAKTSGGATCHFNDVAEAARRQKSLRRAGARMWS